jgi:hypothetical protein
VTELDEFGELFGAARRKCHWEMTIILGAKFAECSDGLSDFRHILGYLLCVAREEDRENTGCQRKI